MKAKAKAVQCATSSLNFWYQRKYCRNAQFTELLFLQNILLIAITSRKPECLFTRVDTGRGIAKTALLIPTLSDIAVCQIPALISECLLPASPSVRVTAHTTTVIAENQLPVTTLS